jgi:hypothetical protein
MARAICREADRALRDAYRLERWIAKVPTRTRCYFSWCDRIIGQLRELSGADPRDDSVVIALQAALQEDPSFANHVHRIGGTFLSDGDNWSDLYRAAGATIYEAYLNAAEEGQWPETAR